MAGLLFGGVFLAPVSTVMASRYEWKELGTIRSLLDDLQALGGSRLSTRVQCLDSIDGCTNVLYRMKLEETSNVLYDEFLFWTRFCRSGEAEAGEVSSRHSGKTAARHHRDGPPLSEWTRQLSKAFTLAAI